MLDPKNLVKIRIFIGMENVDRNDDYVNHTLSEAVISYVLLFHREDLLDILKKNEGHKHYSVYVHFILLLESQMCVCDAILKDADYYFPILDKALYEAQQRLYHSIIANAPSSLQGNRATQADGGRNNDIDDSTINSNSMSLKSNIHFRVIEFPQTVSGTFPKPRHYGMFLAVRGTVVKVSQIRMIEHRKSFSCVKCQYSLDIFADYGQGYAIVPPTEMCNNPEAPQCKSTMYRLNEKNMVLEPNGYRRDFQEIKLQEPFEEQVLGSMTSSIVVTLEDDLIEKCEPGDDVTVIGQVLHRWSPLVRGQRCKIELVLKANSIQTHNNVSARELYFPNCDLEQQFRNYWTQHAGRPLRGRNQLISSFCPQVHGLYNVKLAIMIILAGGVSQLLESGVEIRGLSHILLVGDPGVAKSQLLKYVARLCPRSVFTTGIGSTNAGLTASAVKENGQWHLEAGALVLADGGICCIDEFSTMHEHERAAIHEAMEQQTVSVSKAGIVCRLKTRCSILAACNAKGGGFYDTKKSVSENCCISRPLMSRFDLIFILVDKIDPVWDDIVARHILGMLPGNEMEDHDENCHSFDINDSSLVVRKQQENINDIRNNHMPFNTDCCCGGACSGNCYGTEDNYDRFDSFSNCSSVTTSNQSTTKYEKQRIRPGQNQSMNSVMSNNNTDSDSSSFWLWTFEKIRNYLSFIKTLTPAFKPAAKRILSEYYLLKREQGTIFNPVTVRMLESLIRLAQGHARLMFRDHVNMTDALVVIDLMETSMMSDFFYPTKDSIQSSVPQDPTWDARIHGQMIVEKMGLDYQKLEKMDAGFNEQEFVEYFFGKEH